MREIALKCLEHARQPMHRNGGKRPYAHSAFVQSSDGRGSLAELLGTAEKIPHGRQQPLPLPCQPHASAASLDERKAQLLLQAVYAVADGGLRASQFFRRLCKALMLHHADQRLILCKCHAFRLLFMKKIHVIMSMIIYSYIILEKSGFSSPFIVFFSCAAAKNRYNSRIS